MEQPAPELDEIYDSSTLAQIDSVLTGVASLGLRHSLGAGVLAGALAAGLAEVLDPAEPEPVVVEVDDDSGRDLPLAVEVELVRGAPQASRVLVRRWLLAARA